MNENNINEFARKLKERIIDVEDEMHECELSESYRRYLQGHLDAYNNALYLLDSILGDEHVQKD